MDMRRFWFLKIAGMILVFFTAASALVMVLWNWLMPAIFGLVAITFWQAAGILLLSKIIFGFGKGGKHGHQHSTPWKHWQHKWHNMPEDQREKWKQKFADKWCTGRHETETPEFKKEAE
jgi:hypothetical protein